MGREGKKEKQGKRKNRAYVHVHRKSIRHDGGYVNFQAKISLFVSLSC